MSCFAINRNNPYILPFRFGYFFLCIYIVLFFLLISRRLIMATSIAPFQAYFVKIFEVFVKYKIRDERNEMYNAPILF